MHFQHAIRQTLAVTVLNITDKLNFQSSQRWFSPNFKANHRFQNLKHGFLFPCSLCLLIDTHQSDAMARLLAVTDIRKNSLWKFLREDVIERHTFVKTTEYFKNHLTPHRKQWWREFFKQVTLILIHKRIHLCVWNNNTEENQNQKTKNRHR